MKLVTAVLARNEAGSDRYLKRVLTRCLSFSDTVVLLDDHSTDATPDVARALGCHVHARTDPEPAWGHESSARRELWDVACAEATGPNDWVLIADADQELIGDVLGLCQSVEVNTWSFVLYDMWSATEFRVDGRWQAHTAPRPWLFAVNRTPADWSPVWPDRGIHTGHCPTNWPAVMGIAPPDSCHWLHWSYAKHEHRVAKHRQYKRQYPQMTPEEIAHADSILT